MRFPKITKINYGRIVKCWANQELRFIDERYRLIQIFFRYYIYKNKGITIEDFYMKEIMLYAKKKDKYFYDNFLVLLLGENEIKRVLKGEKINRKSYGKKEALEKFWKIISKDRKGEN